MASTTTVEGIPLEKTRSQADVYRGRPGLSLPMFRILIYLLMTLGAIFFVMPFLWMFSTSLMTPNEIARGSFVPQSEFLGIHKIPEGDLSRPFADFLAPEANFSFSGTSVDIHYAIGPDGGAFDVFIDGQFIQTIDSHSETPSDDNVFTVDSYPSVATLSNMQSIALPEGNHELRLQFNEGESEGDQFVIRELELSDGTLIASGNLEASKGVWTAVTAEGERLSRSEAGEWLLDGEPVPEETVYLEATNVGFPSYFQQCCLGIINRSPRLQRMNQEDFISQERPSGGHAVLHLPLVDQSYIITGGVSHYILVWDNGNFGEYFVNSVIITMLTILGQTLFSILAAYAFAKMEFPGKNVLFSVVLMTIFIPTMVTLIPNLITVTTLSDWSRARVVDFNSNQMVQDLYDLIGFQFITPESVKWLDNWPALVIPFLASTFSIFLLRQFFMQIPGELWDAAQIDGAGHVLYLFRVVVPISKAAITTVVLFTFIGTWDALEWPIIATSSEDWRPIAVGIYNFRGDEGARPNLLMAASMIALFPILVTYLIAQKQFTEGIATTGLKG
ncbi:MAG: ABC transporter permease subunit [Chloroflexi bacterium]|nr:ABC transporter permease subunit [Chloroflexota bacterium]